MIIQQLKIYFEKLCFNLKKEFKKKKMRNKYKKNKNKELKKKKIKFSNLKKVKEMIY
jgi:hypothetical protein